MGTSRKGHAEAAGTGTSITTIGLCLAIALLEGLDLQSAGVAAPGMAKEFSLAVAQVGWAFGAGAIGLLPGAAFGGRLADWFGRKRVLIASVALFGLFSLATTLVWNFESLLVARLASGLGLGMAMPNLIALCSEAAPPHQRGTAVGAMYCGMPFGAAFAAVIGIVGGADAWRDVFYVGGFGPLLMVPLLAFSLPESGQFVEVKSATGTLSATPGVAEALWRGGRARTTLALWVSYVGTLIVLNFLMNWLPSMAVSRGLPHAQAGIVPVMFNVGAGIGAIGIANGMDRFGRRATVIGMYVGMAAALAVLAVSDGATSMAAGGLLCGLFIVGGQSVLYALAGDAYPTEVRGTGVGAAVAVGRLGSILGPVVAGQLFALGQSASMLVVASIPVIVIAALAALTVVGAFAPRGGSAGAMSGTGGI